MKKREGKIYFVSAPGRIKIGFTTKPESRLAQLRNADFEELTVIGVVDSHMAIETKLHHLVEDHQIKGEWFKDCPEVRTVVDDFISGKLTFESVQEASGSTAPPWREGRSLLNVFEERHEARTAAMKLAEDLLGEIAKRAERKEDVKELVRQACFLANHVIAPLMRA